MIFLRVFKVLQRTSCYTYTKRHKGFASNHGPPWSVMFFGTDDFSIYSLRSLNSELKSGLYINKLEVVTSRKAKNNPVIKYAISENLSIHDWPLQKLYNFDVGIVVSFGHLIPENVIKSFKYGILNVHASLLPRWRGAAPIIHAIANQDHITGITIMKIEPKNFDVGHILKQKSIEMPQNVTMPILYNLLAKLGADTLVECLRDLKNCLQQAQPQPKSGITYAPKVTSQMGVLKFEEFPAEKVIALSRALFSLYQLSATWNKVPIKLFDIGFDPVLVDTIDAKPGYVIYDKKINKLLVCCADGKFISVEKVCLLGKRPMTAKDFNNGYLKKEIVINRFFK